MRSRGRKANRASVPSYIDPWPSLRPSISPNASLVVSIARFANDYASLECWKGSNCAITHNRLFGHFVKILLLVEITIKTETKRVLFFFPFLFFNFLKFQCNIINVTWEKYSRKIFSSLEQIKIHVILIHWY